MSEVSAREAIRLIRHGDESERRIGIAATVDEIRRAEVRLGIQFPADYRIFLSEIGYGGYGGLDIMGLHGPDAIAMSADVVQANEEARGEGLPNSVLIIEEGGDGSFYAINLSPGPEHGQIVSWPLGGDEIDNLDVIEVDFGDFLLMRVKSSMEVAEEWKRR